MEKFYFVKHSRRAVHLLLIFTGMMLWGSMASRAQTYSLPVKGSDAIRCGAGTMMLTVEENTQVTSGWQEGVTFNPANVKWYTQPFYGTPIATGLSFTTPYMEETTSYYIDYTGPGGCSQCNRLLIKAIISNQVITPQVIFPSQIFCNSANTIFTPVIVGAASGTFSITGPVGAIPESSFNLANGAFNPSGLTAGVYQVTFTPGAIIGCDTNPVIVNLTVTNAPVQPVITYAQGSYCSTGGELAVTQTGASGGTYSATPSGLSINSLTGTIDAAASQTGTYTVTYLVPGGGGCSPVSATTSMQIVRFPTANISYPSVTYTQNQGIQKITLSGTDAYTGGRFSTSSGDLIVDEETGDLSPDMSLPGTYTVTYSKENAGPCGGILTATTPVTILGLPSGTISTNVSEVCQGSTEPLITFTGSAGLPPYTFKYTINSGAIQDVATVANAFSVTLNHPSLISGTYTYKLVSISDSNGAIRTFNSATAPSAAITITTPLSPVFAYAKEGFCRNEVSNPAPVFPEGTPGTFSSEPAGLVFASGEGTSAGTIDLAASIPGTYTVTNTHMATGGCGTISYSKTITIFPVPSADLNIDVTEACLNGASPKLTFTGSNGTAPYTFTYSVNDGAPATAISAPAENSVLVEYPTFNSGTYTAFLLQVADANGCTVEITGEEVTFTVNTPQLGDFSYAGSPYCSNGSNPVATLAEGAVAGTFSYRNSSGEATGLGGFNTTTGEITLSGSLAGTYTVLNTLPATGGCSPVIAEATVTITRLPVAAFEYAKTTYHQGEDNPSPVYLTIEGFTGIAGAFSSSSPLLNFASAEGVPPGTINLATTEPGTYTVTNTILAALGCQDVTHTFDVTITLPPVPPSITYSPGPGLDPHFCNSQAQAVAFQGGVTGGTYTILPSSGMEIDPNTGTLTTLNATPDTYTVTYSVSGFEPVTADVAIYQQATVNAGADQTICTDATATMNGTYGGSTTSVYWTSGGQGTFDDASSPSAVYTPAGTDLNGGAILLTLATNDPEGPCGVVFDQMTLTIHPLPAAPNAQNLTITYDGNIHTASAVAPEGQSLVWYDAANAGNEIADISTVLTQTSAGTYTAWAEAQVTATGCKSAERTQVTLIISQAPLTLTANDQMKGVGELITNPVTGSTAFTPGNNQLKGFDNVNSVTLTYLNDVHTAGKAAGVYPASIKPSDAQGNGLNNYTITYSDGTMTVAEIIVESSAGTTRAAYNTLDGTFTAINNGVHKGEIIIRVYAGTTEPASGTALAPSGTGDADYTSVTIVAENNVTINGGVTLGGTTE